MYNISNLQSYRPHHVVGQLVDNETALQIAHLQCLKVKQLHDSLDIKKDQSSNGLEESY